MRKRTPVASDTQAPETDRQFVTALSRGLEVLRCFRPRDRAGLSNRDIAERTGLPNSTISRLTYTLLQTGYLLYDEQTGRYRIGVPALSLGFACLGSLPIRDAAKDHMQRLADYAGDGVQVALGARDDHTVTYLACARADQGMMSLQLGVGSRISLARSAMGRAYIAGCKPDERAEILEALAAHHGPERWPGILDGINAAAAQITEKGFYVNYGDWHEGVHSLAVPFPLASDAAPDMALNLGGPAPFLTKDRMENDLGPRLLQIAQSLRLHATQV
ncbi:IclR family transcriptional regulator [Shimia sagamensis]|uniref:Transcriptional regulator, IclR family n=1 Tax=Shimia sagamensis TaxID=1566352 RepID=A0ABY1NW43_9RHOB|nr:IclR family transcriptional regulator [Shimia sagamensis]SMP19907.1 transcriptional regulator, IclR family [Shimia sagamensis]